MKVITYGSREKLSLLSLLVLAVLTWMPDAHGSDYPGRPVTLVVPYAAGGVTDQGARVLAEFMEKQLGKPVVVQNKPGGGTTIGGNAVATAKPDGYTLGLFPVSASIPEVFTYFYEAPYSSKDLKAVSRALAPVLTITVKYDAPWNSVKDLVEYAGKNPGMKIATHGKSTLGYLVMRTIGKKENVSFTDVPFAGGSQIVPAILGGHVPAGTPAFSDITSLVEAKKFRVLAVLVDTRVPFAPDVPSVPDLGYKLAFVSYLGLFGPKGVPNDVVKKLDETVRKATSDSAFQKKISNIATQVSYEETGPFEKSIEQY